MRVDREGNIWGVTFFKVCRSVREGECIKSCLMSSSKRFSASGLSLQIQARTCRQTKPRRRARVDHGIRMERVAIDLEVRKIRKGFKKVLDPAV